MKIRYMDLLPITREPSYFVSVESCLDYTSSSVHLVVLLHIISGIAKKICCLAIRIQK